MTLAVSFATNILIRNSPKLAAQARLKRSVMALLLLITLLHSVVTATPQSVERVTPSFDFRRAELSLVLPVEPTSYEFPSDSFKYRGEKIKRGRIYTAYHDRAVFIVEIYEANNPARALAELLETRQGMQDYTRDVQTGGVSGRLYRRHGGNFGSAIQYFSTGKCVYALEVAARDGESASVKRFLASLRLTKDYTSIADDRTTVPIGNGGTVGGGGSPQPGSSNNSTATPLTQQGTLAEAPLKTKELTHRIVPIFKPEPGYTETARRNNTQGTVTLRLLLFSDGTVRNITPIKRLPDGLSEKAIAAAKLIRFLPAEKDGRVVSTYAVINYAFAIY